jgi:hypothetical protein
MRIDFREIADLPDQKQKIEVYKETLLRVISEGNVAGAREFFDHSTFVSFSWTGRRLFLFS